MWWETVTLANAWGWILSAAAAIVALAKAWEIVRKALNPSADLRDMLNKHDNQLKADFDRLNALEQEMKESRKAEAVMCRALFAQINHELSGNDVEILRQSRDEMQDFLIKR